MARILKRPMFRRGGMPSNQGVAAVRPQYMGGGMGGIMSGIIPRPDAGLTPRVGYQALGKVKSFEQLQKENRLKQDIANKKPFLTPLQIDEAYKKAVESAESGLGVMGLDEGGPGTFTERAQIDFDTLQSEEGEKAFIGELTKKEKEKEKKLIKDGIISPEESVFGKPEPEQVEPFLETTSDTESDLMRAYKEYAPIFEKELGVSPEDTKKSLYLQLAKFGAGLAAQPGGDLVGAVGKAAMPAIEGAGATVKDQSTAKRQAKILALQTAIKKTFTKDDKTATAAETKRYATQAKGIGLEGNNAERFINDSRILAGEKSDLVGKFNDRLPEFKDLDEDNVGAYYVSKYGQFVRVIKEDGEIKVIGMDEPGFKDKAKEK